MKFFYTIVLLTGISMASEVAAMQRGCDAKGAEACDMLGLIYEHGLAGVKQDASEAKAYYLRACELGYDKACKNFEIIKQQG